MSYVILIIIVALAVWMAVRATKKENAYFASLARGEGPHSILRSFKGTQKSADALINRYFEAGYDLQSINGRKQLFSGTNFVGATLLGLPGLGVLTGATTSKRKYELLFVKSNRQLSPSGQIEERHVG